MDFAHYNLDTLAETGVGVLGEGVLHEVAYTLELPLGERPSHRELVALLQSTSTKSLVEMTPIGGHATHEQAASDQADIWLTQSGILKPVSGAFIDTDIPIPVRKAGQIRTPSNAIKLLIIGGTTSNLETLSRFVLDNKGALGDFQAHIVKISPSPTARQIESEQNLTEFVNQSLRDSFENAGVKIEISQHQTLGRFICERNDMFMYGNKVIVSNVGHAIPAATQLRSAVRELETSEWPSFDVTTSKLVVNQSTGDGTLSEPYLTNTPQLYMFAPGLLPGEKPEAIGIKSLEEKSRMMRQMLRTAIALEKAYPKL